MSDAAHEVERNALDEADRLRASFPLPARLQEAIEEWLASNEKAPEQVRYGSFPLGMVGRWIERAEEAEARVRAGGLAEEETP